MTQVDPNKIVPFLQRRFGGGEGAERFEVYAPQAVREHPRLLEADDARERLAGTEWLVRCRDGYSATLTFEELLMLVDNVAAVADAIRGAAGRPAGAAAEVRVNVDFSPERLTPEKVQTLLRLVEITIPPRGDA